MAPALTDTIPTAPHQLAGNAPLDIFPDGLKTTGQHPPLYDHLVSFDQFPRQIEGPTVWKAEDYRENPERWTHVFTPEQVEELSAASDAFLASKTPLTGISKVCCSPIGYELHPYTDLFTIEQISPSHPGRLPRKVAQRSHRW